MMENSKRTEPEQKSKNNINYELEKIYSKIIGKDYISYKFNKIVLGTKRLVSSNLNYNDFSKEYDEKTKITCFKYPDIGCFPISKNFQFVSLGRMRYSYDSTKSKIHNNNIFSYLKENKFATSNSTKLIPRNRNFFIKSNSNKVKINNNIGFLSQDNKKDDRLNKKENIFNNDKTIGYTMSNSKRKIAKFNIKNNLNYGNTNNKIFRNNNYLRVLNYKKYINNNRTLLRDSLLNEKDYSNLKYNENKIFLSSDYYNNFIMNHINNIKKDNLRIKYKKRLEKIYEKSKYNNLKLILKPIIIEFKKIFSFVSEKEENFEEKQIFEIPFEYTPIFYTYNLAKIKHILMNIFYLDNHFKTFNPDFKKFSYLIETLFDFNQGKSEKEEVKRGVIKKIKTTKIKNMNSFSTNKIKQLKKKYTSYVKENLRLIDIFNNDYNINKSSFSNTILEEKDKFNTSNIYENKNKDKIYFSNNNCFECIWLTPSYEYLVTIKTPEISFYIKDIEIKKIVDIELIFFFLENNFINWDFYTIEYLFSFYKFAFIINNFLSIYKNKYFFKNNLLIKNKTINLSEEKKSKYSLKNLQLEYIYTDEDLNNFIKIFHSYKILVFNEKINKQCQFCFHINFNQMKSLYYSMKKQGIKNLIEKILIINQDSVKIKLNYDYLDNFSKNDLNNLENLVINNYNNNNYLEGEDNKFVFNINENKITLYNPVLENIKLKEVLPNIKTEKFFEVNEKESNENISLNILEKLLKKDNIYMWPSIIEFATKKKEFIRDRKAISLFQDLNVKQIKSMIIKKKNILKLNEPY